jgi:hypothetical protein
MPPLPGPTGVLRGRVPESVQYIASRPVLEFALLCLLGQQYLDVVRMDGLDMCSSFVLGGADPVAQRTRTRLRYNWMIRGLKSVAGIGEWVVEPVVEPAKAWHTGPEARPPFATLVPRSSRLETRLLQNI